MKEVGKTHINIFYGGKTMKIINTTVALLIIFFLFSIEGLLAFPLKCGGIAAEYSSIIYDKKNGEKLVIPLYKGSGNSINYYNLNNNCSKQFVIGSIKKNIGNLLQLKNFYENLKFSKNTKIVTFSNVENTYIYLNEGDYYIMIMIHDPTYLANLDNRWKLASELRKKYPKLNTDQIWQMIDLEMLRISYDEKLRIKNYEKNTISYFTIIISDISNEGFFWIESFAKIDQPAFVNSKDGLNIRELPSIYAKKVGLLPYKSKVRVLRLTSERVNREWMTWVQIGKNQWVAEEFLTYERQREIDAFLKKQKDIRIKRKAEKKIKEMKEKLNN